MAARSTVDQARAIGSVVNRSLWVLCAVAGFLGVALGAFGAHALKTLPVEQLAWWETGARYHLIHAVAIGLTTTKK